MSFLDNLPAWAYFVNLWFAGALAGYGACLIMRYALPEREGDPRFGVILLFAGVGLLLVALVALWEAT